MRCKAVHVVKRICTDLPKVEMDKEQKENIN